MIYKITALPLSYGRIWCAHLGSNQGQRRYEHPATTTELYARNLICYDGRMYKYRVILDPKHLVHGREVRRYTQRLKALEPVRLDGNPHFMSREIQTWLLTNVGHSLYTQNELDRYYYRDEIGPSREDFAMAAKVPKDLRLWHIKKEKRAAVYYERHVFLNDQELAVELLLRFGIDLKQQDPNQD